MHEYVYVCVMQHRFYGKSVPFGGNKKVAYANSSTLGYLSSTQALADYATLIIDLKKNLSATESPVVVFGGSYGGSIIYNSILIKSYFIIVILICLVFKLQLRF
jgi:alpha-beta hydrolase superfamily lysophospholipase